jgi:replicative DNA helicase
MPSMRQMASMYVPTVPRLLVDDVTAEKLAILLGEQGGRIALMSSEGEIFAIMAGFRYSDTGSPSFGIYLVAHSGEDFLADRVTRASVFIKAATLTVGLTVQPGVLGQLAEEPHFREQGLLARFFYSIPVSKLGFRKTRTAQPVPDSVAMLYQEKLTALLKLEDQYAVDDPDQRWPVPRDLTLSPDALDMHWQFAEWVEPQFLPGRKLANMPDWGGKLVGGCAPARGPAAHGHARW